MRGIGAPRAENFLQPRTGGTRTGLRNPAPLSTVPEIFRAGVIDLLFSHWDDLDPGLMRRLEPRGPPDHRQPFEPGSDSPVGS
jgi:hypothetical protein